MKASHCHTCGFKTKEINKTCPLCQSETEIIETEDFSYAINLPQQIKTWDNDVYFGYYCTKCHKKVTNRVCVECNNLSALAIMFHGKRALIHQIEKLEDIFTKDETLFILSKLSTQDKHYMYHHFAHFDRFFYRIDKVKAGVCLFIGLLMYALSFMITTTDIDQALPFVGIFSNAFGNGFLSLFAILAIWYLFKPTEVEQTKLPMETAIVISFVMVIYVIVAIFNQYTYQEMYQYGFIFMGIQFILYAMYIFLWRKKR